VASRAEAEIDLGRWVRRVGARWYLVLACVVLAVAVASLSGVTTRKTYTARTLIFLGQPYANNTPIQSSLGTNPATPSTLIREEQIVDTAATKAGLRPDQLRGRISAQPVAAALTKVNYTPLVRIVVQGPWKDKVAPASLSVAQQIVARSSDYSNSKITVLKGLIATERAERSLYNKQYASTQQTYRTILRSSLSSLDKTLVLSEISNRIAQLEARLGVIEENIGQNTITLAQAQQIESSSIVTKPRAVSTTATSGGANYGVAVVLGLLVGVLVALLSYAVWQPRPMRTAASRP
jgi:hypothetical protein